MECTFQVGDRVVCVDDPDFKDLGLSHVYYHGEDKHWHRTRESAVKRANDMRDAKIKSLEKSIAKLKKMEF